MIYAQDEMRGSSVGVKAAAAIKEVRDAEVRQDNMIKANKLKR